MNRYLPYLRRELFLAALVVVAVFWARAMSPYYFSYDQIVYSLQQSIVVPGFLALGLAMVVICGAIDISLPSILALGGVAFAELSQAGVAIAPAVVIVLAISTLAGMLNGLLTVQFGLPSLAVTLGSMEAYRALALLIGGEQGYADFPPPFLWLGSSQVGDTPVSLLLLVAILVVLGVLLHATVFGGRLFAIGSNLAASRASGVSVDTLRIAAFAFAGLLSGVAALVYIGQYQSARADNASDMLLPVLAAVMLGGVDIFGGRGNVVGLALSLLLIGTLKNGMGLANVSGPTQDFVTGLVLVVAVTPPPRQLVASLSRVRSASVDAQGSGDNDAEGASSPPDVFVRKSK